MQCTASRLCARDRVRRLFLRRLHSLSGIVPVGAFLFEHILISNSTAISGPDAYAKQVAFLGGLPLVFFLELFGIWLPIAFHALYGFYIWYRGEGNTVEYPWTGNWMYTLQRWTGGIAFFYIVWHTYTMRFTGTDLHAYPNASFGKVQAEVDEPRCSRLLCSRADRRLLAFLLTASGCSPPSGASLRAKKRGKRFLAVCLAFFLLHDRRRVGQPLYLPGALPATDR